MNLAIIGDADIESFFDKLDTKDKYKIAQLNGKGCAFLCAKNDLETNLLLIRELGIDKVIEISENDIDKKREKMSLNFGIEYSGFSVKGPKSSVRLLLNGIMASQSNEKVELLSGRERDVISLLAKGMTNKEIAGKLYLSEKTVKNHLNNIFRKIDVTDRTKAALYAINNKLG